MMLVFVCSSNYISNPYLSAKLVEVMYVLNPAVQPNTAKISDMLLNNPLAIDHLVPALMRFYTGRLLCHTGYMYLVLQVRIFPSSQSGCFTTCFTGPFLNCCVRLARISVILITNTLVGDKVSMLTHTYPHKPLRKNKVTICNHQADSPLNLWPDVWFGDCKFRNVVLHDAECPYWDQVSLNNTNPSTLMTSSFQLKLILVSRWLQTGISFFAYCIFWHFLDFSLGLKLNPVSNWTWVNLPIQIESLSLFKSRFQTYLNLNPGDYGPWN